MTTLWDTTAAEIVATLGRERLATGAVATGLVLTLVAVTDERSATAVLEAAAAGASAHPCRLLVVIRRQPGASEPRLDADVTIGGVLGAGESVVLRVYGELGAHAESVVLPLLAPDTPVVTWWHGAPPDRPGDDPLGHLATRRITDAAAAPDSLAALRERAAAYSPGDTDLAWTRLTPWRSLLASAFDTMTDQVVSGVVIRAEEASPSAHLLAAWLHARLGTPSRVVTAPGPGIVEVRVSVPEGDLVINRPDGLNASVARPGQAERLLPLPRRDLGDLLGEELRRLGPDEPYAATLNALAAAEPDGGAP